MLKLMVFTTPLGVSKLINSKNLHLLEFITEGSNMEGDISESLKAVICFKDVESLLEKLDKLTIDELDTLEHALWVVMSEKNELLSRD